MDLSTEAITREKCHRIRDVFRDHDLPVCAVSGYRNLVHPDPAEREANIRHLKALLRHARDLGRPYVISETGTFDPASAGLHHPRNKTDHRKNAGVGKAGSIRGDT